MNQAQTSSREKPVAPLVLEAGARIAVIGGGPAGSFFSYFFLETAPRIGLDAEVHIYEPRNFSQPGPASCNMCGGIVSESLVQILATEGINLPSTVVQRGVDSYVLHMDVGSARIEPPGREKRIAAVHRGAGPRGVVERRWQSFDGHLLGLAQGQGATVVRERVEGITWEDSKPRLTLKRGLTEPYDLVVVASGVNAGALKLLEGIGRGYAPPRTTKTFICELPLGAEAIETYLGSSMHVFLLDLPRLEFAALIPKGEYATLVLLGSDIDRQLVASFFAAPEVKDCLPPGWSIPDDYCRCFPSINVLGAPRPYSDRLVVIGDCGENRLYKDGIGGAYRAAKAAAITVVFEGVGAENFHRHYWPVCRSLRIDNSIGKVIFAVTRMIQKLRFTRRGIWRMVSREQQAGGGRPRLSGVLWDTFTGSAPYRSVFWRTLHPLFVLRLVYESSVASLPKLRRRSRKEAKLKLGELGKVYRPGELIIRQGDPGDCMYVVQSGKVEVFSQSGGKETRLAELGEGDFFGEMALFEQDVRSASVRPLGEARVLTVDRRMFMRKIHEDPSLAFRVLQRLSRRIRQLNEELTRLRT